VVAVWRFPTSWEGFRPDPDWPQPRLPQPKAARLGTCSKLRQLAGSAAKRNPLQRLARTCHVGGLRGFKMPVRWGGAGLCCFLGSRARATTRSRWVSQGIDEGQGARFFAFSALRLAMEHPEHAPFVRLSRLLGCAAA